MHKTCPMSTSTSTSPTLQQAAGKNFSHHQPQTKGNNRRARKGQAASCELRAASRQRPKNTRKNQTVETAETTKTMPSEVRSRKRPTSQLANINCCRAAATATAAAATQQQRHRQSCDTRTPLSHNNFAAIKLWSGIGRGRQQQQQQ